MDAPRSSRQRKADTIAKLQATGADTWVATASSTGATHLIPLSYAWDGECIVLAAPADSVTVKNIRASGRVRLGFGPTRDVVLIDAELERALGTTDDEAEDSGGRYADQADWDPRLEREPYVFLIVRPRRIQAWRERNELAGKFLMRDGEWLF
jgi:hypothetical protein